MSPVRVPLASKPIRYGIVVIVAVLILVASVEKPGVSMTHYSPFGVIEIDKWYHGTGYAVLTATLAYAFVAPVPTGRLRRLACSVGVAVVFGACMELIQWPIPYRTASEIDAAANAIGACLLAALWWWLMPTVQGSDSDGIPTSVDD